MGSYRSALLALPHNTDALKQYGVKLLREAAEYCTSGYGPDRLNSMADELEKS
jgi:hypothetical protein